MSKDMKFLIISFILSSFTIIVNSFSSNYDDYDNQCVFRNSLVSILYKLCYFHINIQVKFHLCFDCH